MRSGSVNRSPPLDLAVRNLVLGHQILVPKQKFLIVPDPSFKPNGSPASSLVGSLKDTTSRDSTEENVQFDAGQQTSHDLESAQNTVSQKKRVRSQRSVGIHWGE